MYFEFNSASSELFKLQVLKSEETLEMERDDMSISGLSGMMLRPHRESVEFDMLLEEPNQPPMLTRSSLSTRNAPSELENINIFDMDRYEAPKHRRALFSKASHRKHISHYKNRLKLLFKESKIHMLMPSYKDNVLRLFRLTLHRND